MCIILFLSWKLQQIMHLHWIIFPLLCHFALNVWNTSPYLSLSLLQMKWHGHWNILILPTYPLDRDAVPLSYSWPGSITAKSPPTKAVWFPFWVEVKQDWPATLHTLMFTCDQELGSFPLPWEITAFEQNFCGQKHVVHIKHTLWTMPLFVAKINSCH